MGVNHSRARELQEEGFAATDVAVSAVERALGLAHGEEMTEESKHKIAGLMSGFLCVALHMAAQIHSEPEVMIIKQLGVIARAKREMEEAQEDTSEAPFSSVH